MGFIFREVFFFNSHYPHRNMTYLELDDVEDITFLLIKQKKSFYLQ